MSILYTLSLTAATSVPLNLTFKVTLITTFDLGIVLRVSSSKCKQCTLVAWSHSKLGNVLICVSKNIVQLNFHLISANERSRNIPTFFHFEPSTFPYISLVILMLLKVDFHNL